MNNSLIKLPKGTIFCHLTAKDSKGNPIECFVVSKCKTWKTKPKEFSLPVKCDDNVFSITHNTISNWIIKE